jgi:hypothetical protein
MKNVLILVFVLFNNDYAFAQKKKPQKIKDKIIYKAKDKNFRFNISNLLGPIDGNLSIGFEYFVKEKYSICTDIGYIFYSNLKENITGKSSGVFLRPAFRYYTNKNFFLESELDLLLRNVDTKVTDWLGKDCVNDVPAYFEKKTFTIHKKAIGVNAKIGTQLRLLKNKNIFLELYIGFGAKIKKEVLVNEPNSCYAIVNVFGSELPIKQASEIIPYFPAGLRLYMRLK